MRRYGYDELVAAFTALDRVASSRRELTVIGGAAVVLHTRTAGGTKDIDTFKGRVDDLVRACAAAGIELPPIGPAGVSDLPYDFEDRCVRVMKHLHHLEIRIPERHDLALSKVLRWAPGDQDDIRELHDHAPLDRDVLVERYLQMDHVMGGRSEHDANVGHCIEALFDEIVAEDARERIARHRRQR